MQPTQEKILGHLVLATRQDSATGSDRTHLLKAFLSRPRNIADRSGLSNMVGTSHTWLLRLETWLVQTEMRFHVKHLSIRFGRLYVNSSRRKVAQLTP